MCTSIHASAHMRIHTSQTYIRRYIYICIYIYINKKHYVYKHTCIGTYAHTYQPEIEHLYTKIYVYIYVYIYIYKTLCVQAYMHRHICAYIPARDWTSSASWMHPDCNNSVNSRQTLCELLFSILMDLRMSQLSPA